ncbi:MAG: radical SAM protein, partial [Candidatus Enterousia sp.]
MNIGLIEFEEILNGNKLSTLLNNITLNDNVYNLEQLKNLNSLIYILLEQKIIEPINEYSSKNRKIWLKSCLIELTDCCNFRCPHCYVDKQQYHKLSFANIKDLAEDLLALNCNKITLTGGEILTHNEFISIYEYLYKKGFIIGLNTNGSLFNDKIINALTQMPPYA